MLQISSSFKYGKMLELFNGELERKFMKNIFKPGLVVILLLVVSLSLSACGSKTTTPVAPVVLPTNVPTEPVNVPSETEIVIDPGSHVIQWNFDCTTITDVPQTECEALVYLYNTSNGNNWLNKTNWLTTSTVGNWHGVTVIGGQVSSLDLSSNQLAGYIPSELGNLTKLRVLSLSVNQLTGEIPASLGNLTNLTHLFLSKNQLTGGVPADLGNLRNLQALNIYENQLSGSLPVSLVNLTALTNFGFFGTSLCEPATADYQTWKTTIPQYNATGSVCQ